MNAAFFGLACLAALNPKLLVIDLILAANQRPWLMFMCFLLGGIGLGLTIGLLDVLVLHVDAIKTQNHASGGLDLALGIPLLAIGALLAAGHLHIPRRRAHRPPKDRPPPKLAVWVQRVLHEPRYGLAVLIGAAVGTTRRLLSHRAAPPDQHQDGHRGRGGRGDSFRPHLLGAGARPVRVPGIQALGHRKGAQAVHGLAHRPRTADRRWRRPPRRWIYGDQRPGARTELTYGEIIRTALTHIEAMRAHLPGPTIGAMTRAPPGMPSASPQRGRVWARRSDPRRSCAGWRSSTRASSKTRPGSACPHPGSWILRPRRWCAWGHWWRSGHQGSA